MKELRCIRMQPREVLTALGVHRQRMDLPALPKDVVDVVCSMRPDVRIAIHFRAPDGTVDKMDVDHEEVLTAVVSHLLRRKVKLPVQAEKVLFVVGGQLFVLMTMNFQKKLKTLVKPQAQAA